MDRKKGFPGKVGIFWDYENVRIPRGSKGVKAILASNQITKSIQSKCIDGIESKRFYYDSKKLSEAGTDRENIDLERRRKH